MAIDEEVVVTSDYGLMDADLVGTSVRAIFNADPPTIITVIAVAAGTSTLSIGPVDNAEATPIVITFEVKADE